MSLLIRYAFKRSRTESVEGSPALLNTCGSRELGGCALCGTAVLLDPGVSEPLVSWAQNRKLWLGQRLNGLVELGVGVRRAECAQEGLRPRAGVQSAPGRHHRGAHGAWSCPGAASSPSTPRSERACPRLAPPAERRRSINNHKPPAHPPLKIKNTVIRVISDAS